MLENIKPAQTITVTIKAVPGRRDARQTIARLMRQDDEIKAGLRRTQAYRRKNMLIRTRAGRPWTVRKRRTLVAKVEKGASWTMPYFPQLVRDIESVAQFLEIRPA